MSLITQDASFYDDSINYLNSGCLSGLAYFHNNARNYGSISTGLFFNDTVNYGSSANYAVFSGNAVNSGSFQTAVFYDTSCNMGGISVSGFFYGNSKNKSEIDANTFFGDDSSNEGAVGGSAIFADNSSNAIGATVAGDACFATTATNNGTVFGSTGVYGYPASGTILNNNTGLVSTVYITEIYQNHQNGTYDIYADGCGGQINCYYYCANGYELYDDGSMYHYLANGGDGYNQFFRSGYACATNQTWCVYITECSVYCNNGTFNCVADGIGGWCNDGFNYCENGYRFAFYGDSCEFVSDGNGSYCTRFIPVGTVICGNIAASVTLSEAGNVCYDNGTYSLCANGDGSTTIFQTSYCSNGHMYYQDGFAYCYVSNGNGGYSQCYISCGQIICSNNVIGNISIYQINCYVSPGIYDVITDGAGGCANSYHYCASGYELAVGGTWYHYVSDGAGSYNEYYVSGWTLGSAFNYVCINNNSFANGEYSCKADGLGGWYQDNNSYCSNGYIFTSDSFNCYVSDGCGGVCVVPL